MRPVMLAALCANAYAASPLGRAIDAPGEIRAVVGATMPTVTVRGTVPADWQNWLEDAAVAAETCRAHPQLGPCAAGALDAAERLLPLLRPSIASGCILTGHSLGGQIAADLAGLLVSIGVVPAQLMLFDPPKSGGAKLKALLSAIPSVRVWRFRGSPVTDWPLCLDEPVARLEDAGDWTLLPIEAHSIDRAMRWFIEHDPD